MVEEILTIKECMKLTGMSRSTIYKFMEDDHPDKIPFWKKGGKLLFDKSSVEKWLRNEFTK